MRRHTGLSLVVTTGLTVLALCVTFLGAQTASAASYCVGPPPGYPVTTTYHSGYYYNPADHTAPDYYEGASAYIVPGWGENCTPTSAHTPPDNFDAVYVMIAGHFGTSHAWGQVGFIDDDALGSLRWFSQYFTGSGNPQTWFSPGSQNAQVGVRHAFRVLYAPSCACLQSSVDGNVVSHSTFDPFTSNSGFGSLPWSPQFSAEAADVESDIPGYSSNGTATPITSMGVQKVSDDTLVSIPCILDASTDTSRWGFSASTCYNIKVFTRG